MSVALPGFVQDAASAVFSRLDNVIFRSRPAGGPIPRAAGSWSFAAVGDFGAGTRAQLDVARNILRGPQQMVLSLGDAVYERGLESEYRRHFDPPERFGDIRARFPVFPTVGNHDVAGGNLDPYFRRFPEAQGRRFYSFDRRNARFFSVDSTQPLRPGTAQWKLLETALSQAWEGWKIVYFHHPLRSGLKRRDRPEDARVVGELFARHGVDLLITGHDHSYDRSRPLNDYGTIQVTAGNGGRMLYPYLSSQPDWSAYRDVQHGHVDVEVRDDALVVRHVTRGGSVGDTHEIRRRPRRTAGEG